MKRFSLNPHPDGHRPEWTAIEVAVRREPSDVLELDFHVTSNIAELRLPRRTSAERADELWRHTCFETFLRAPGDDAYLELNFSPSTEWAAYHFTGWRDGMSPALECPAPSIRFDVDVGEASAEMYVGLPLSWASRLRHANWHVGLAAILEDRAGRKSYWALAHAPGPPDFHHADAFVCELPR